MRWLDIGWHAHGVIAIGQFATGVIAIGQVAWGVVAIGQAAFGWLAVGQVAVGGVTVGMVGVGLHFSAAMVGLGGRGKGLVLPLLPSLGEREAPPGVRPLSELRRAAERAETSRVAAGPATAVDGWTRLHLVPRSESRVAVFDGYDRVEDLRIDARCRRAALAAAPGDVWAHVRRLRGGWVADRLVRVDPPRFTSPRWWLVWGAQLMASMLVSAVVWWVVAEPVIEALTTP
jgi:hypothetical protein